jgi:hypothetical protein
MSTPVMVGALSAPSWHACATQLVADLPRAILRVMDGQDHGAATDVLAPVLMEFFETRPETRSGDR